MKYLNLFSSSRRRIPDGHILVAVLAGLALLPVACSGRDATDTSDGGALHPSFSLSRPEFGELIAALPQPIQDQILARPVAFLDQLARLAAEPEELTRLVDKEHPLAADHAPDDLANLDNYSDRLDLSRSGHRLREILLPDLLEMVDTARAAGVTLLISSTYRSYHYQEQVYERWVEQLGREEADRVSARPGRSQHQLGTVVDFGCICNEFAETDAGRWIASNARRYGFSLSYPNGYESLTGYSYESWHFRYIGKTAAGMEREFFAGIQQHLIEFVDGSADAFRSVLIEI